MKTVRTTSLLKDIFAMAAVVKDHGRSGVASGHLMVHYFLHLPANEFINAVDTLIRSGLVIKRDGCTLIYNGSEA
jgi:hypothetical protein